MKQVALNKGGPVASVAIHLTVYSLAPVIALILLDWLWVIPLTVGQHISNVLAAFLIFAPKILLLFWLGSRTMGFTEQHYERFGSGTIKTALFIWLSVSVLVVTVSGINAIQRILYVEHLRKEKKPAEPPTYQLSFSSKHNEYVVKGVIDFGITRDMRAFIKQHPGGARVNLDSIGGSIYEGRGLASLFRENGLGTHVDTECSSACTLAFIGGKHRTISNIGILGFHQYAIDYTNLKLAVPFYDPIKEQERDRKAMLSQGIDADFIDKAFNTLPQDMWYPYHDELLRANIVHDIHE